MMRTVFRRTAPAALGLRCASTDSFRAMLGDRNWGEHQAGDHARVFVDSDMFAWLVMDRAGSSANALGEQFMASLKQGMDIIDKLVAEKKVRIAIITSAKDTFCVGADLEQLYPVTDKAIAEAASKAGQQLFNRIEESKYPVVAAINGLALGGGCELALACHHRVISDKASMGLPETLLGLLPGAGGTVRLQELTGIQTALGWILKGSPNKADKCKKAGVVDAVVGGEDRFRSENRFFEGARAWAGKLVDKPLRPAKTTAAARRTWMQTLLEQNPLGRKVIANKTIQMLNDNTKGKYLGQYKALESVMFAAANPRPAAFDKEAKLFAELMVTPEAKNQCALYFLDDGMKKVEKKTGVKKEDIRKINDIGVIGAGVMGSGIVHFFVNKGHRVAVKDITPEAVEKGVGMVRKEFEGAVKRKRLDKKGLEKKMAFVTGGTDDAIFANVDVIVEAAVEIMDIKKKLLMSLEEKGILDGKKLFATNTSSLSVTELQSVSKFPETIVGMHFFNPVAKMPLVEVIVGEKTSKEAAAAIFQLSLKTGKKPIIVKDAPGFLVNRILGVYMAEAGRLAIKDRAEPKRVDQVMLNFGMPMGPFRLLDEVGLDVACHVGPVLEGGLKSKRFAVDSKIEQLVKDGFLGKKNGKGLYQYDEKQKALGMNTAVTSKYLSANPDSTFSTADIQDRCVLLMANEAALILAEGVAASPEDVDIGMVFGTGFAPFRGGLLQYVDHRGIQQTVDRLNQLRDKCKDDRFAPAPLLVDMAKAGKRFFPNRPFLPYVERTGFPTVNL
jgi:3-hydroxyacyl-CoA dehydrogenase/enoyl-CoA hydratase/3-hydroxybutyryl-CoA epimerase